jgi:hypothetical protein
VSEEETTKPGLLELVRIYNEVGVANRLIRQNYGQLMFRTEEDGRRLRCEPKYYSIGDELAELTITLAKLQDRIGGLINERGVMEGHVENE